MRTVLQESVHVQYRYKSGHKRKTIRESTRDRVGAVIDWCTPPLIQSQLGKAPAPPVTQNWISDWENGWMKWMNLQETLSLNLHTDTKGLGSIVPLFLKWYKAHHYKFLYPVESLKNKNKISDVFTRFRFCEFSQHLMWFSDRKWNPHANMLNSWISTEVRTLESS